MSEDTYQFVIKVFALSISSILVMIVGVLCFRVALDGESTITKEITDQLVGIVPWLAGALVAAIVGTRGISAFLAGK